MINGQYDLTPCGELSYFSLEVTEHYQGCKTGCIPKEEDGTGIYLIIHVTTAWQRKSTRHADSCPKPPFL